MNLETLPWWVFALFGTFAIGSYNTFLEGTKAIIPKKIGFTGKHIFMCCVLTIAGLISFVSLLIIYSKNPKTVHTVLGKHILPQSWSIIIPGCLLAAYMVTNALALSGGGGVAMCIINLNLIVTITAGHFIFKDKINSKIIIAAAIAIIGFLFAAYESNKINK